MATIGQQVKRLEKLNPKEIVNQVFKALKEASNKIETLNIQQLDKGEDSNGKIVGTYAFSTQQFADRDNIQTRKTFDTPYNFSWSGEFLEGFELSVKGTDAVISSKGIGSGGKKDFLTSNNLFGLNDENLKQVIKEDILPFIQRYARKTLKL